MKFTFCVLFVSVIAVYTNAVQASINVPIHNLWSPDQFFEGKRKISCHDALNYCTLRMREITDVDIRSICDAAPVDNLSSKCLIDCQMRRYKLLDENGLNAESYVALIDEMFNSQVALRVETYDGYKDGLKERTKRYMDGLRTAIDLCWRKEEPWNDSCEAAYTLVDCIEREGMKRVAPYMGYRLFYHAMYLPPEYRLTSVDHINYMKKTI